MFAIRTDKLRKVYRDAIAVDGLDLTVQQGELFALLGVNGAGKTTTLRLLSCLTRPTSGDALLNGHSIRTAPDEVKRIIGVSPQETAIAPGLTAQENLALMGGLYGLSREKQAERLSTLTALFGLEDILRRRAGKLSGGWQRRLSIAMAMMSEPQILFLDEPTLGLDVLARSELWTVIRALKGRVTIILTTHYMEEAEALADHVGIMRQGRLLVCDTVPRIRELAGTDSFEQAFIRLVKEGVQ